MFLPPYANPLEFIRWLARSSQEGGTVLSTQYRRGWVAFAVTLLLFPVTGCTQIQIERYRPGDTELATIVLPGDKVSDVVRKLTNEPCEVPASNPNTVSMFYQSADGTYLRFEVSANGIESMTMSVDTIIAGVCSAPLARSLNIGTGKGVHLGDSMEKVLHLYGAPTEQFTVGSMVRIRYYSERERGRYYEWSLVFRKDRLVEWAAYSYE
jgi:hypothetical protein